MSAQKVTYEMPSVSVIIRESGKLSAGSTYGYSLAPQRVSMVERLMSGTFNLFAFLIGMALFVASVSLTSYLLVSLTFSENFVSMRSQEIPSDGIVHVIEDTPERTIERIGR